MIFARVGEAANPGPFTIGTANPCGALGKAHLFQDTPGKGHPRIWGLAETHLSAPGIIKFQQEAKYQPDSWKFVPSAPAPLIGTSAAAIGGKATGVGVLTNCPTRPLPGQWNDQAWKTGRIQTAAVHVQQQWIKVGAFYGYARDAHTKATKDKTDALLSHITERIVLQSKGFRAITGDFNALTGDLPQFDIWRAHGFREVQEIALHKWHQPIAMTCKNTSVKDHVWISPELIGRLQSVCVDSTFFADHAIVYATFQDLGSFQPVPIWRKPQAIQWEDIPPDQVITDPCPASTYHQVFQQLEQCADQALRAKHHPGLMPNQKGRCQTQVPKWLHHPITPVRPSRKHECQVLFLGEHWQHTQWIRQLRRIQSHVAVTKSQKGHAQTQQHKTDLWHCIRAAPGFPGGFPRAWRDFPHHEHSPASLPHKPPGYDVASAVFHTFQQQYQALTNVLNRTRREQAKSRRVQDPNVIFKDVARPRAMPVQSVVTQVHATVTAILNEGKTIQYQPAHLACDFPVEAATGPLIDIAHTPGELVLTDPGHVEVGDLLSQQKMQADLPDIFAAFEALWKPMWQKHEDTPVGHWDGFVVNLLTHTEGASDTMPLPPITTDQWMQTVQNKKSITATGPDGVSRLDLLRMPALLTDRLVQLVNEYDTGQADWPQEALQGHITSVEKVPDACSPQEFRPITVLPLPYRVWASIRAKQALKWLDSQSPPGLVGNRPNCSTANMWWHVSQAIEAASNTNEALTGIVTDIKKCFNNLARPAIYACARHFGLPLALIRTWHNAVARVQRSFVVSGAVSPAMFSSTGYPEGDPLSVVAMSLLNIAMHKILEASNQPAQVLSFVDNWR